MRDHFPGHYAPSEPERRKLWNSGLIVLDTNVLLSMYRLPEVARNELLGVLDALKERIWIPHHVGLEFQRRRLDVIKGQRSNVASVLEGAQDAISGVEQEVDRLKLDRWGLGLEPDKVKADLGRARERLTQALKAIGAVLVEPNHDDPIRGRLDDILEGCVGPSPASQQELDQLLLDAEDRYASKTPPGYKDAHKGNKEDETYVFNGLRYSQQYGDLIIWKQVLERVATEPRPNSVLFVTGDLKEDYWQIVNGERIGPRPELAEEIRRAGDVDVFWMYSPEKFAELAPQYTEAEVSRQSISQIHDASVEGGVAFSYYQAGRAAEDAISRWLRQYDCEVQHVRSASLDFEVAIGDPATEPPHVIGVALIRGGRRVGMGQRKLREISKSLYVEIAEGRAQSGSVIITIIVEPQATENDYLEAVARARRDFYRITDELSIDIGLVVGRVEGDRFAPSVREGFPLV
ncbi:MAG: PIN-like domain-containing protein [Actinomycetota bacterium]